MSDHSSETLRKAAAAAEKLLAFYPTINAADPKVYASGLVQLFSRYPDHLVAAALDPVNGLPSECEFLPTIAKVKAFLEPRYQKLLRDKEMEDRFNRKKLPEPERSPEEQQKVYQGLRSLADVLRNSVARQRAEEIVKGH